MNFTTPTSKAELFNDFELINQYYKPQADDFTVEEYSNLTLPRLSLVTKTTEQIATEAEGNITAAINAEKAAYLTDISIKKTANIAAISAAQTAYDNKETELLAQRESEKAAVDTDLCAKGISNGTLSSGLKAKITARYAKLIDSAQSILDGVIAQKNAENASLTERQNGADTLFQLKSAAAKQSEIIRLNAEYQKQNTEANKYNNSLTEKEQTFINVWKQSKMRIELSLKSYSSKGYTEDELDAMGYFTDKLSVLRAYYASTTALAAYNDFASTNAFVSQLGKYYYETLYEMYRLARAESGDA